MSLLISTMEMVCLPKQPRLAQRLASQRQVHIQASVSEVVILPYRIHSPYAKHFQLPALQ